MKKIVLAAAAALLIAPTAASARAETRAMLSKSCSMDKMKELSSGAITAIKKGPAANIYTVTLDTSKMSWVDLTKKMNAAGCFK